MIKRNFKKHDNFTLELKNFYPINFKNKSSKFAFDIYFIVPENLFIYPPFFDLGDFYKLFKNYVRFKTPRLSYDEIIFILKKLNRYITNYKDINNQLFIKKVSKEIKLVTISFCLLIKNSSYYFKSLTNHDDFLTILNRMKSKANKTILLFKKLKYNEKLINYKELENIIMESLEYIYIYLEKFYTKLYFIYEKNFINSENKDFISKDGKVNILNDYKNRLNNLKSISYLISNINKIRIKENIKETLTTYENLVNSSNYLKRKALLKKKFSSVLFLDTTRGSASFIFEQIIFSIAAGLSMLIATIGTIYSQSRFSSNLTSIILLIIVFLYIIKDRLKDFLKFYLLVKLKKYIYNFKINVLNEDKKKIAKMKEGVWFIKSKDINKKRINVYNFLKNYLNNGEYDLIHYRKIIKTKNKIIRDYVKNYQIDGIDDILRFNLEKFNLKMDDSKKKIKILKDNIGFDTVETIKSYNLYFVMNFYHNKNIETDYYYIELNRDGILDFKKINF